MTRRSPASVIIFSIITCGIYSMYWLVVTTNELNHAKNDENATSGGMTLFLTLITCGIYYIFWHYKQGKSLVDIQAQIGMRIEDNSVMLVVLSLIGLGIVSDAIMQEQLNKIAIFCENNGQSYNNNNNNNGVQNYNNNNNNNGQNNNNDINNNNGGQNNNNDINNNNGGQNINNDTSNNNNNNNDNPQ